MSNQITSVVNRQHQSLTEADRLSLKRALHDYIIEEDLNVDDLQSNMDLANESPLPQTSTNRKIQVFRLAPRT